MFYNTFRTTKSSMRSAEKARFTDAGQNIINQRERLLNLQKRQKLKDLLITKFMQKYGVKHPEKILEEEITKFLQGQKLTDADLRKLDMKVKNLLKLKASNESLKNPLTKSMQEPSKSQGILPRIETNSNKEKLIKNNITISSTEPNLTTLEQPRLSSSVNNLRSVYSTRNNVRKYKRPEEELAELEAEFAEEEAKKKKTYERLEFKEEGGDEWFAIAKYNRKLYEDQINEEKKKDAELKRRNKEDLDLQIRQKLKKEYEDELKEKEYEKILMEHQKQSDEMERQKQEQIKKQILKEKEFRDEQMRLNNVKRRIDFLKEKKFEKSLVKSIQDGLERDKNEILEKKRRENEALLNAIKENEIKIKNKKEKEKREKEEEIKMGEERIKMQMKQDLARKRYYDQIKQCGNHFSTQSDEIIKRMKKMDEDEEKKIQFYYDEKNRLSIEKEKSEELKRRKNKYELKKYLDMQIEEKKKEEDFFFFFYDEQARIWAIDCKKYHDDEKAIENKIRSMNQKNLELLREQMNRKNNTNNRTMTDTEYAMNRDLLTKAKASLYKEN